MSNTSPQEVFDRNYERAWEAVEASREPLDAMQAAQAEVAALEEATPVDKRALKAAKNVLARATSDFNIASTTAGYYANMEGEENPLINTNITRKPSGEVETEDELAARAKTNGHAGKYFKPADNRFAEGLRGIRSLHSSPKRSRQAAQRSVMGRRIKSSAAQA